MDQVTLVATQIEDGRRLIERLVQEGFAVTASCWARTADDGQWYLYIASPAVRERGTAREAYRRAAAKDPGDWELWLQLLSLSRGDERARALARLTVLNPGVAAAVRSAH